VDPCLGMASLEALVEVVPWFGGTLIEEPSAEALLADLVQLVVPSDLAPPVEEPLHDVSTAAALLAVPFLS
jgi:hypothetical protein